MLTAILVTAFSFGVCFGFVVCALFVSEGIELP
jgi:hypothetical protein